LNNLLIIKDHLMRYNIVLNHEIFNKVIK